MLLHVLSRRHVITKARFVNRVTKHAAMSARFVTNERVTNRAAVVPSFKKM